MLLIPLILMWFQIIAATPPSVSKLYRDYKYNGDTDYFYNFHSYPEEITRAQELCSLEGASLFRPEKELDFQQLYELLDEFRHPKYVWVGSDYQDKNICNVVRGCEAPTTVDCLDDGCTTDAPSDDYYGYDDHYDTLYIADKVNVNGVPFKEECAVRHYNDSDILKVDCDFTSLAFVCKVDAKDAPYDEVCDVYDTGYEYVAAIGNCYKLHKTNLTWTDAINQCTAVNSKLVKIDSDAEQQAVKNIIRNANPIGNFQYHNYSLKYSQSNEKHWFMCEKEAPFRPTPVSLPQQDPNTETWTQTSERSSLSSALEKSRGSPVAAFATIALLVPFLNLILGR